MKNRFMFRPLLAIALCCASGPGPAFSDDGAFGDWNIQCTGAEPRACTLGVSLIRASDQVEVLRLQAAPKLQSGPMLIVSAPLGVFLPDQLRIAIDGRKIGQYPFSFCDPAGCHLAIPLKAGLLNALKRGRTATIGYRDRLRQPVRVDVSLIGFTKGYNAL